MNLGFKKSIDAHVFKKILDIKNKHSKGYAIINVENVLCRHLKSDLKKEGIMIKENKLDLISDNLIQYKFEWS